jgi:hypothetical protein
MKEAMNQGPSSHPRVTALYSYYAFHDIYVILTIYRPVVNSLEPKRRWGVEG